MVVFFFLKMPIGFAMMLLGVVGVAYVISVNAGFSLLGGDNFANFSDYNYTAFPMFIFSGSLAFATGLGNRLFDGFYILLRRVPGSLVIASIAGCAGFAAICGSSTATAATMAKVAIPEMKKYGYDDSIATASIAVAGTLGPLIPPSNVFIFYGVFTGNSIGKLFVAGILPGILIAFLLAATAIIMCIRNPSLAPIGPPATR